MNVFPILNFPVDGYFTGQNGQKINMEVRTIENKKLYTAKLNSISG